MKYYIATKLDNQIAHNNLRDWLALHGHEITFDWTKQGAAWLRGIDAIREVAELEANGVLDADIVIVLWPGGRGTHVELGMAIAAGKRVLMFSPIEEHHTASPETCAFYHHPLVELVRGEDELIDALKQLEAI